MGKTILKSYIAVGILLLVLSAGEVSGRSGLVGWWNFDDGTTNDSSGNNLHGTLETGGKDTSVSIVYDTDRGSKVLDVNNPIGHKKNSVVNCGNDKALDLQDEWTMTFWCKVRTWTVNETAIVLKIGAYGVHRWGSSSGVSSYLPGLEPRWTPEASSQVDDGGWHHVTATYDAKSGNRKIYIDGIESVLGTHEPKRMQVSKASLMIGGRRNSREDEGFNGWLDDVRVYKRVLSPIEIRELAGNHSTFKPCPSDGADEVDTSLAAVEWKVTSAIKDQDVYFGTNLKDVQNGAVTASKAAQDGSSLAVKVEPRTIYYWRVDGKDGDGTVHKGDVWQFRTASLVPSYPEPADKGKYVSLGKTRLSWQGGYGVKEFEVYFGTDKAAVAAGSASKAMVSEHQWEIGSALLAEKTYYWRVDADDYKGSLWSFTTGTEFVDPNLLGRWTFDNGTAEDSSGSNHHGTLIGNNISIINNSERGKVLSISGTGYNGVNCGGGGKYVDWADIIKSVTMAAWVKVKSFKADNYYQYIASKGDAFMMGRDGASNHLRFYNAGIDYHPGVVNSSKDIRDSNWHFVVFVYDWYSGARYLYVDGKIDASASWKQYLATNDDNFFIGGYDGKVKSNWMGMIDDVRLYDRALSAREVRALYGGGFATKPEPADTTGNVSTDITLSWTPGDKAAKVKGDDLYFGTDWYDVKRGDKKVRIGLQDSNSFKLEDLKAGTTYYWKVNANNDCRVWPGYIWSFRTETEGFYKDLFQDSALRLVETTEYPAAKLLALSYEHLTLIYEGNIPPEEQAIQDLLFIGNEYDDNGVLLYPDGEPRFRCIYVSGGGAGSHGRSLGEEGRKRVRDFYNNGGSYSGSCAGAFICSKGTSTKPVRETYFGIWPAQTFSFSGVFKVANKIPADSPFRRYYDFGGDFYIDDIQHWNGPSAIFGDPNFWYSGTEVCTIYDAPGKAADGHADIWAYKKNADTGRVVPIGSHPERMPFGEQRDLTAAVLRYAMDGQGSPNIKASLESGVARRMNDNKRSGREKIGDKQYHHFTIDVPEGTNKLTIALRGNDAFNLDLFARKGNFAFKGKKGVITAANSSIADETINIDNPSAGLWYIAVKGVDTVETTKVSWGWQYCGNLEVLNGVAYTITAGW